MNRPFPLTRFARVPVAALGCLLAFACSSTPIFVPTTLAVSFVPGTEPPPGVSVTLQPGEVTDTLARVRVSAQGTQDFFGAAFWITYDITSVAFTGYDDSASFLRDDGSTVTLQVDPLSKPGTIKVGFTRVQNGEGTVQGVDVTVARDLIVLEFGPRKVVEASPIVFASGHGEVVGSGMPPSNTIEATWVGGSFSAR